MRHVRVTPSKGVGTHWLSYRRLLCGGVAPCSLVVWPGTYTSPKGCVWLSAFQFRGGQFGDRSVEFTAINIPRNRNLTHPVPALAAWPPLL